MCVGVEEVEEEEVPSAGGGGGGESLRNWWREEVSSAHSGTRNAQAGTSGEKEECIARSNADETDRKCVCV